MSENIYDKPDTTTDPFRNVSKEVIHDRNDLVLQQFLEKQANRKKGIVDDVDILVDHKFNNVSSNAEYPIFIGQQDIENET